MEPSALRTRCWKTAFRLHTGELRRRLSGAGLFRLAWRAGRWRRVRRDDPGRRHLDLLAGQQKIRAHAAARPPGHEYLLGRCGYEDRLHHDVVDRKARRDGMALSGPETRLQRLSRRHREIELDRQTLRVAVVAPLPARLPGRMQNDHAALRADDLALPAGLPAR